MNYKLIWLVSEAVAFIFIMMTFVSMFWLFTAFHPIVKFFCCLLALIVAGDIFMNALKVRSILLKAEV